MVEANTDQPSESSPPPNLSTCPLCGRKFLSDRLDKHIQVCQKVKERKRKMFDSVKQRAENLDKINNYPTEVVPPPPPPKPNKESTVPKKEARKSSWREQHEEFIKTIRAARGEAVPEDNSNQTDSGPKPLPAGVVECPGCGRRFSERAAERHVAWCASKKDKQTNGEIFNHTSGGGGKNQEALERMKARTKYKPPPLNGQKTLGRSKEAKPRLASPPPLPPKKSKSPPPPTPPSKGSTTVSRKYTRTISRSSENLQSARQRSNERSTNRTNMSQRSRGQPSPTRTESRASLKRDSASNRTVVVRRKNDSGEVHRTSNYGMKFVKSKINTGLHQKDSKQNGGKKSAPVMKFKEKFPNHQHQTMNHADLTETILRRNSTIDDSPKTVPGVRTGGFSPVKNGFSKSDNRTKSESNLHQIDDIKKRIDLYISGLYDNQVWNNYGESPGKMLQKMNSKDKLLDDGELDELNGRLARQNSANSDEARGSTSDSTDSGLGVVYINGTNGNLLETVLEDGRNSKDRHDLTSPPMSEVDRSSRLLLRNGSLNDLYLLDGGKNRPVPPEEYFTTDASTDSELPRFCHQCGTKYPNTLAKFCYECGSKRFGTVA